MFTKQAAELRDQGTDSRTVLQEQENIFILKPCNNLNEHFDQILCLSTWFCEFFSNHITKNQFVYCHHAGVATSSFALEEQQTFSSQFLTSSLFQYVLGVIFVMALNNVYVSLHGVPPGWSTLMKLCEIQPARLPCLSTSTNHPPSCTRFSSWALFSCSMTATAQNRWWIPYYGFFMFNLLSIFFFKFLFFYFSCFSLFISFRHWLFHVCNLHIHLLISRVMKDWATTNKTYQRIILKNG